MTQQPIYGITSIQQDIKLEVSNGTLTLKAGSKIYIPNGVGVFNVVTIQSDISNYGNALKALPVSNGSVMVWTSTTYSGGTAPETPNNGDLWYDTTNNIVKRYSSSSNKWIGGFSLPLALLNPKAQSAELVSDVQTFNGFGYIGSTLFVLPGVEGFYPSGKNGFKNLFSTKKHNSVTIKTITSTSSNSLLLFTNSTNDLLNNNFKIVDKLPDEQDMVVNDRYYNKQDNYVYYFDGNSILKDSNILYGYVTTTSSSPYRITSFDVVNPFATITSYIVSDYSKYLSNLLIIQYNNKPRAKATIESIGAMLPDELILSVRDGFSLETASGNQLDILSKYIGASRGYTDTNSQKAVLTDEEFRVLLKLKIITNTGTGTLYGLETSLYNLFGTGIRVVEGTDLGGNPNMTLTYYIRSDWANVGLAAVQQKILPHPTGVGYTYNLAALTKYFGFIEYTDTSHPFTTGFRDYNDPTKPGEMYAYDKVIE